MRKFVHVTRYASNDNITERGTVFEGPALHFDDIVFAFSDSLASGELLYSSDIDTVDTGAVVC